MTKAIEIIKDIIEDYLWYDGEVYPIVDDTNQISYVRTGVRMGSGGWLKLVSTWAYNGYTITLNPAAALEVKAPVANEIVVDYNDGVSTQTQIASALQTSEYITTATAASGASVVTSDDDSQVLAGGRFFVKRKEGGHITKHIHTAELYNVKCESNTEENVKKIINNLRLLSCNVNSFSYVYTTTTYPYWIKFGDADDKQNIGNNEFIITISLDARFML